jgi:hypothetical protein
MSPSSEYYCQIKDNRQRRSDEHLQCPGAAQRLGLGYSNSVVHAPYKTVMCLHQALATQAPKLKPC